MSTKSIVSQDFKLSVTQYIHLRYFHISSDEIKITAFNSDTFLVFCHLSLLVTVPLYVIRIIYYYNDGLDRDYDTCFTALFSISLVVSIACEYSIWYLRRDGNEGHPSRVYLPTLQVVFLFSLISFNALRLITQLYKGNLMSFVHIH